MDNETKLIIDALMQENLALKELPLAVFGRPRGPLCRPYAGIARSEQNSIIVVETEIFKQNQKYSYQPL
ncbi:MAG: hypothetical protein WBI82_06625 [Sphaerochaeta sp.]